MNFKLRIDQSLNWSIGAKKPPKSLHETSDLKEGLYLKNRLAQQIMMPILDRFWPEKQHEVKDMATKYFQTIGETEVDLEDPLYHLKRDKSFQVVELMERTWHPDSKTPSFSSLNNITISAWEQSMPSYVLFWRFNKPTKKKYDLYMAEKTFIYTLMIYLKYLFQ